MIHIILDGIKIKIICNNQKCFLKYITGTNHACFICKHHTLVDIPKIFEELPTIKKQAKRTFTEPVVFVNGDKIIRVEYE